MVAAVEQRTRPPVLGGPGPEDVANVLGVGVHAVDVARASERIERAARDREPGWVCVAAVHTIICAQHDEAYRRALGTSMLTVADGRPLAWMGWLEGHPALDQVRGMDLLETLCARSVQSGVRHYFYGGRAGVAERLARTLEARYPGLPVAGFATPSFQALTAEDERAFVREVEQCGADVVWVGFGSPKQEQFCARMTGRVRPVLIGVGAAFDFVTGDLKDAPDWMRRGGLQWMHRLAQEPRRLARRYAVSVPEFLVRAGLQLSGLRRVPLPERPRP
jgi:N-acetylglucosaminyldiphosphoundecaprenol N-acetyl-beta-D-mannosaminyltransferase